MTVVKVRLYLIKFPTWLKISDAKQIHVKLYIRNCFRTSAIVYLPRLMFYPSKSHVELITLRYFD